MLLTKVLRDSFCGSILQVDVLLRILLDWADSLFTHRIGSTDARIAPAVGADNSIERFRSGAC